MAISNDRGAVRGVYVNVIKHAGTGSMTVCILQGDKVLVEDEATGIGEGASCTWGTP